MMNHEYALAEYDINDLSLLAASCQTIEHNALWAIGDIKLLSQSLLGFFCSNKCTGDAILRTYDLARGLRDASIPVISGFHSAMEKECLDLLLRGTQPIIICPARSIHNYRLKKPWLEGIDEGRILILSPFEEKHRQPSSSLAEVRNHLVATLAARIFVSHAEPGSKTEKLCLQHLGEQKQVIILDSCNNETLKDSGAEFGTVESTINLLINEGLQP